MLAKINGLFRLTRNAELKYTQDGKPILNIGLACSEKYGEKETQLFLDATVFSKQAEILNKYAGSKGTQIYLSGKLKTESWTDNQSGQKRSKTVMIVEGFDFVSGQSNNQQNYQQPQNAPQQYQQPKQQNVPVHHENIPAIDIDEDEIPF